MSIETGLILVLFVSVAAVLMACAYFSVTMRFVAAFVIPIIASAGLYWLPNLFRLQDGELRTWFVLFFITWSVPSIVACIVAASIFTSVQHRHRKRLASNASE